MTGGLGRLYWRAVKRWAIGKATGFWSGLDLIPRQGRLEARTARDIDRFVARGRPARVPDFVIIGVPKSATSWLRAALDRHPAIGTVQEEIEFFGANFEIGLDAYLARFAEGSAALDRRNAAGKRPYGSLRLGEKSASLAATSEARIGLMQRLMPEARLIIMLRDPVERHWAHAKRFFSKRRFGKKAFAVEEIPPAELEAFFLAAQRFGRYREMLERWWRVFGRESLLVLWQEEVADDPAAVLDRSFRHIGVDPDESVAMEPAANGRNRGPAMPMPPPVRDRLESMFVDEYRHLQDLFGDALPPSVASACRAVAAGRGLHRDGPDG